MTDQPLIEHWIEDGIHKSSVKGTYVQAEALVYVMDWIASIRRSGLGLVLIDYSECDFIVDVTTSFWRSQDLNSTSFEMHNRLALVFKEITKELKYYQQLLTKSGFNVELFTLTDEAIAWLKS